MAARDDKVMEQWLESDCINNFDDFSAAVLQKSTDLQRDGIVVSNAGLVLFLLVANVASSLCPSVVASVKVWRDMTVDVYDDKEQRDRRELAWLLGDEGKLTRWSQLPNICAHLQNTCT